VAVVEAGAAMPGANVIVLICQFVAPSRAQLARPVAGVHDREHVGRLDVVQVEEVGLGPGRRDLVDRRHRAAGGVGVVAAGVDRVAGEVGQAEGVRAGVDRGDDDEPTVELFHAADRGQVHHGPVRRVGAGVGQDAGVRPG
jgi:hypothetical protein